MSNKNAEYGEVRKFDEPPEFECAECGEMFTVDTHEFPFTNDDGEIICDDCHDEYYRFCPDCENDLIKIGDFCPDCGRPIFEYMNRANVDEQLEIIKTGMFCGKKLTESQIQRNIEIYNELIA